MSNLKCQGEGYVRYSMRIWSYFSISWRFPATKYSNFWGSIPSNLDIKLYGCHFVIVVSKHVWLQMQPSSELHQSAFEKLPRHPQLFGREHGKCPQGTIPVQRRSSKEAILTKKQSPKMMMEAMSQPDTTPASASAVKAHEVSNLCYFLSLKRKATGIWVVILIGERGLWRLITFCPGSRTMVDGTTGESSTSTITWDIGLGWNNPYPGSLEASILASNKEQVYGLVRPNPNVGIDVMNFNVQGSVWNVEMRTCVTDRTHERLSKLLYYSSKFSCGGHFEATRVQKTRFELE